MSRERRPPAGRYQGQKWKTELESSVQYLKWFAFLKSLYCNRFEYEGLPKSVKKRWIEEYLFDRSNAVFFELEPGLPESLVCLPFSEAGRRSLNGDPTKGYAYSFTGHQYPVSMMSAVVMWDNTNRWCNLSTVDFYAKKLATIEMTADVNLQAQKTPLLILCPESQRLTMENLYKKYNGNIPVIFGDKELLSNAFTVLKTDAPYLLDDLMKYKMKVLNEALTYMGINNVDVEKAERLITSEVASSNAPVIMARYTYLDAREQACEELNDMFGLNVSVKYRDPVEVVTDALTMEGGADDGSLYDDDSVNP